MSVEVVVFVFVALLCWYEVFVWVSVCVENKRTPTKRTQPHLLVMNHFNLIDSPLLNAVTPCRNRIRYALAITLRCPNTFAFQLRDVWLHHLSPLSSLFLTGTSFTKTSSETPLRPRWLLGGNARKRLVRAGNHQVLVFVCVCVCDNLSRCGNYLCARLSARMRFLFAVWME